MSLTYIIGSLENILGLGISDLLVTEDPDPESSTNEIQARFLLYEALAVVGQEKHIEMRSWSFLHALLGWHAAASATNPLLLLLCCAWQF